MNQLVVKINSRKFSKYQTRCFQSLLRYSIFRRIKISKTRENKKNRISLSFMEWKKYYLKEKKLKAIECEKNENLLKIIMICWKRFLSYKDKKRSYLVN